MKKNLLRIAAPVLVIALGVALVFVLKATAPKPQTDEAPPRPTTVYTRIAESTDATIMVATQGQVRARTAISLTAEVSGRVISVGDEYVEGGEFDRETVLLEIDDSDYRAALRQAEAQVAAAELAIQQALADADVAEKQLRNIANPSALSLKKPQIAEARARKEAAIAGVELARLDLARTKITLPFSGRVAATSVHIGEYVTVGSQLGQVFSIDRVQVRLPLTNQQLASLGLPIGFTAGSQQNPTAIDFSANVAGQVQAWTGYLLGIDAAIDPETRLIYATGEVEDPYGTGASSNAMPLAVGLFVDAKIAGKAVTNAIRIPSEGLRPGNQVYVVDAYGRLDVRTAELIHDDGTHALLSSGMRSGERVVVSALRNPISGMQLATIDDIDDRRAIATRGN